MSNELPKHINSNMTAREVFNLYGTLPESMIETLLDLQDAADSTCGVKPYIEEAMAMYPGEDFIESEGVIDDLRNIAKNLRGDNRAAVLAVIEKLDGIQLGTSRQAEYGKDELRKALSEISGV